MTRRISLACGAFAALLLVLAAALAPGRAYTQGGSQFRPAIAQFSDARFGVMNATDPTKIVRLSAAGLTTATTRTWTMPDRDDTFAGLGANTLTGLQTFNGGLTIASNTFNFRRATISGATAPTCTFTSGGGTGPSCAPGTGSSDSVGAIVLTTGTAPGNTGTATLTFSAALGTNSPVCIFMPYDGAASWNARAISKGNTATTAAAVLSWDNNAVNLTASTTYAIAYHCVGK